MIAWKILQIVSRHWDIKMVADIIGAEAAEPWKQMTDPNQLRTTLNIRIVGGSTDKPTSKMKKKAALEIGQVVGQFANAIPAAGMIVLKVFERAFSDDITITDEDWKMLQTSMEQQQRKAGAGPGGAPGGEQPAPSGDQAAELKKLIESLPPEAKQKMEQLIQSGVSPTEALKQVTQGSNQTK